MEMDVTELPLTIRDAIYACRRIHISHLWVDSLCIIQDDEVDKAQEIRKMHEIYQGAVVTLLASRSTTCHDGFLHQRSPYLPRVALLVRHPTGYDIAQLVNRGVKMPEQPIDKRAWTFQERILSNKVLNYSMDAVKWRCVSLEETISGSESFHQTPSSVRRETEFTRIKMSGTWNDLITNYSKRLLTDPRDKLIAIAAVAQDFAKRNGLESYDYLGGLWKPTLLTGLLWRLSVTAHFEPEVEPSLCVAPSWSWASLTCPVEWDRETQREGGDPFADTAKIVKLEVEVANK